MQNLSTGRGTVVSGVFVLTVFVFVGLSVVTLFYSASVSECVGKIQKSKNSSSYSRLY